MATKVTDPTLLARLNGQGGTYSVNNSAPGMIKPGNLNLDGRNVYHAKPRDEAGEDYRTENSISIGTDEGEVLIPTVVNGRQLTDDEAIAHFKATGENLGTFKDAASADAYAQALHERQAAKYAPAGKPDPAKKVTDSYLIQQLNGKDDSWWTKGPAKDATLEHFAEVSKGASANQAPVIGAIVSSLNRNEPGDADWETPGEGEPGIPIIRDVARSLYPFERNKKTGAYRPSVPKVVDAVIDAVKLPGDVYSGKTDPMSDEGIGRSAGFATIFSPGAPKVGPKAKLPGEPMDIVPRSAGKAGIPTAADIKQVAQQAYGVAETSEISAAATPKLRQSLMQVLNDEGLVLPNGKVVGSDAMKLAVKMASAFDGQPMTFKQFQRLEEKLQDVAASKKAGEGRVGQMLLDRLDKYFDELPDGAFSKGVGSAAKEGYSQGKAGWATYSKLRMVEKAVENAALTKGGFNEALRDQFRTILKSERKSLGLSPEERKMMRQFVMGGKLDAVNDWLSGLRGLVAGTLSGGVVGALAVPMAGAAGKAIAGAGARNTANQLRASIAAESGSALKPPVSVPAGNTLRLAPVATNALARTAAPAASLRELRLDAASGAALPQSTPHSMYGVL